jgi:hypothetical protein
MTLKYPQMHLFVRQPRVDCWLETSWQQIYRMVTNSTPTVDAWWSAGGNEASTPDLLDLVIQYITLHSGRLR